MAAASAGVALENGGKGGVAGGSIAWHAAHIPINAMTGPKDQTASERRIRILFPCFATAGLIIRIFAEERLVAERYPGYGDYASHTKRIIPFVL